MAHYLFNFVSSDRSKRSTLRERAAQFLRVGMWGIDVEEPHRNALAAGDLTLIYLGAPEREFIGRAELASAAHDWAPSEGKVCPGDSPGGVLLAQVEQWDGDRQGKLLPHLCLWLTTHLGQRRDKSTEGAL